MRKTILFITMVLAIAFIMEFVFFHYQKRSEEVVSPVETKTKEPADYRDVALLIDGQAVNLVDGYAEQSVAPDSASKIITRYFGNELKTDLNNDGREDVAFIVTQETGGSGTFFYAVAAIATADGYVGTDGYLLGDRIAPQTTTVSPNPQHVGVVVFNYAERRSDEPMSATPSVGKSVYLKLDVEHMQWGVVVPDFEGEEALVPTEHGARVDGVDVTLEY